MSEETAEELMDMYEKWDSRKARRTFIARMERKLDARERRGIRA